MARDRAANLLGVGGLALAVTGAAASVYLAIAHYSSTAVLACPDTGTINCTKVTTSSYATQFGVPIVLFGLAFFGVTLALQNPLAWRSTSPFVRQGRLLVAAGGAAAVLWLVWVELFRLDAICLWCTVVHATSILLFILTVLGTAATTTGVEW